MVNRRTMNRLADGFIVADNGVTDPVQNFLNSALAYGNPDDRMQKILHCPAAFALYGGKFSYHG